MSANQSKESPEKALINIIEKLQQELQDMKTNQLNVVIIPRLTADPASPVDGQIWLNTTGNVFKIRISGVTKTVTVT